MKRERKHTAVDAPAPAAIQVCADVQVAAEAPCEAYVSFADVAAISRRWLWERLWATAVRAVRLTL